MGPFSKNLQQKRLWNTKEHIQSYTQYIENEIWGGINYSTRQMTIVTCKNWFALFIFSSNLLLYFSSMALLRFSTSLRSIMCLSIWVLRLRIFSSSCFILPSTISHFSCWYFASFNFCCRRLFSSSRHCLWNSSCLTFVSKAASWVKTTNIV